MNSENSVRNVEYTISPDNLAAAVEEMLRRWKFIKDSEDVKVRFGSVKGPLGDVFSKNNPIPLHLEISEVKEVQESIAQEEKKLS